MARKDFQPLFKNALESRVPTGILAHTGKYIPHCLPKGSLKKLLTALDDCPRMYDLGNANNNWPEFVSERNKMIVLTQYYLALRPSEVVQLKFTDFDRVEKNKYIVSIRPETNKERKGRKLPVPSELKKYLLKYFEKFGVNYNSNSAFLFPSLRHKSNHLSRCRYNDIFQEAIKRAGLWRKHPTKNRGLYTSYSLRHSRAVELLEKSNFDIWSVSNILGHSSISVTMSYLHATEQLRERWRDILEL